MSNTQTIGAGFWKLTDEVYHADPCPVPSLSASIIKRLVEESPRHAWQDHPRLNPNFTPEKKPAFDIGTAAHELLLLGQDNVVVVDARDWRTKAAKEERDAAYAAGKTPLLTKDYEPVLDMVDAVQQQMVHIDPQAFVNGMPEHTMIWEEGGTYFRTKPDWLPDASEGSYIIYDFKTTGGSAAPDLWGRTRFWDSGNDMRAAFYMRGARRLGIRQPRYRFVVAENKPPHSICVMEASEAVLILAEKKLNFAIDLWRKCLEADEWPGYPAHICQIDLPPWRETQWLDREIREEDWDADRLQHLIHWQRPTKGDTE